nr:TPA_asm: gasderminX [Nephila orb-weaver spider adintovirus]
MPVCSEQTLELLKLISKTKHPKSILKKCSKKEIKTLCECVLNVLCGNISLTKIKKNRLSPYKESLRKLSNKKTPLYEKKKILIQKGEGFLNILLPAAISVISSLIQNGI